MTRIFVYGTLKRGRENHHWLAGQRFIAEARTKPVYRLFDMGGYPGMTRDDNGAAVEGEIWEVDEGGLARLDVLEDIEGGEYERVMIEIEGDRVEGYLYLRSVDGRPDAGANW
ncbi:gamma-glutamylcyclotransferase family protein [Prosthecobacter sp.]|uniref:gamma-glutamylcyclotransferase family protein n=1 Tax=Prosthecobacter sp. TaxID=1965333 RepID=UPI002AB9AAF1|nr:gamma-glutamylcyclotransferase family protein [Prosthecobacter sp.]MDZ4405577.1 gamma-glutamylcyclotransferase family protein [Prosthecobacter sp.]